MQRIGRVDRRLDPEIEAKIVADHPDQKDIRQTIVYWNFLPPDELNTLLSLYHKVTRKTLRISQTFGIEGGKLLRPEDDLETLREFNASYEQQSKIEEIKLEYDRLLKAHPSLAHRLDGLPGRVFSGKQFSPLPTAGEGSGVRGRAVFFCYALPAYVGGADNPSAPPTLFDAQPADASAVSAPPWSTDAGPVHWYLYDLHANSILEEPSQIVEFIRCQPDTPRHCTIAEETLADIRTKIEKHIKNTYLKSVQAPLGVKPALKAWLELNCDDGSP